jgi:peroxiredoxin
MTLKVGDLAPQFSWLDENGKSINLSDISGKRVVLYFYPKDNTPGCTIESKAFADKRDDFMRKGAYIVGVSKDSVASHKKFTDSCGLNFPLISDTDGELCQSYGTWVEKSMFGKKYMGIARTTFLIDPNGKIEKIWPDVSVLGHAQEVLASF